MPNQPTQLNQPTYQSTKQPTNQQSTNQGIVDDDSPPLSQSATDSLSVPPRHMLLRHWQQRPSEHTQSHTTCTNSTLQHKATPHVPIRLRSQPHSQLPAQIHTRHHSGLHTQLRLSSSSVSRSASCSSLLVILGLNFLLDPRPQLPPCHHRPQLPLLTISQGRTLVNSEPQLPLAMALPSSQRQPEDPGSSIKGHRRTPVDRPHFTWPIRLPVITSEPISLCCSMPSGACQPTGHSAVCCTLSSIPGSAPASALLSPIPRPLSLSTLGFDLELRSTHTLPRSLLYPGGYLAVLR